MKRIFPDNFIVFNVLQYFKFRESIGFYGSEYGSKRVAFQGIFWPKVAKAWVRLLGTTGKIKNRNPLFIRELRLILNGGRYWTRTSDPYNVSKESTPGNSNHDNQLHESENPVSSHLSSAKNAIPCLNNLAEIVAAWPRLPNAIKTGMLAMVRACGGGGE